MSRRNVLGGVGVARSRGLRHATSARRSGAIPPRIRRHRINRLRLEVRSVAENDRDWWTDYQAGTSFAIPGDSHFEIEVVDLLDYVCHFG